MSTIYLGKYYTLISRRGQQKLYYTKARYARDTKSLRDCLKVNHV